MYSPNNTHLLNHRKSRVAYKHMRIKHKAEHPKYFKGYKVFIVGYYNGRVAFSCKPKREGLFQISINTAIALRNYEIN